MDTVLISEQDATVLLRLVIVLEGQLLAGGIDAELSRDLQRQFERADLISESGVAAGVDRTDGDQGDVGRAHLRLALANLNQRLRYALGEYDAPVDNDPGWSDQHFAFPSVGAAELFLAEARAAGDRGLDPVLLTAEALPVSEGSPWRVVVTIQELVMTAAFDAHVQRLSLLAARHGGACRGFGGPGSAGAR
jgi:hypothetical protein